MAIARTNTRSTRRPRPAAPRRRRRRGGLLFSGGAIVLCLVWFFGDPFGEHAVGPGLPGPESPAAATPPGPTAAPGPGAADPGAAGAVAGSRPEELPPTVDDVLADRGRGLLRQAETAIAAGDLGLLALLEARATPLRGAMPADVQGAFTAMEARIGAALAFGPRLKELLGSGQVLLAAGLVDSLRRDDLPAPMVERVEALAVAEGWPSLLARWRLTAGGSGPGSGTPGAGIEDLPRLREVRFRRGDGVESGRVWRCSPERVTVRQQQAGGYVFPVVARAAVEPVDPSPAEALAQGRAAARAGEPLLVVLWCCCLKVRGATAEAAELQALLRDA